MTISERIQATIDTITEERLAREADPNAPTPTSDAVGNGAMAAVFGGRESPAWRTYMGIFGKTAEEMNRLVPPQPDLDPDRETARVYLVRNGVCGMSTGQSLGDNVGARLDV